MIRKAALVGAGRWGKNLARNLHQLGVLETICDTNESLLDHHQEKYPGIKTTTNVKNILRDPLHQLIFIASPAATHYSLAKEALLNGKDVYVEKPLCLDSKEAEELIHLAEKNKNILMVGHILHYHPCVRRLQELVNTGQLGDLQYIVSNRLNLGPIRTEESALWDFAPHDVSVILSLCGHRLPCQVRCTGGAYIAQGVADTTLTTLRFEGDIRAHIYVSWLNPFKEQKLVVMGSAGMAVFDDTKQWEEKLLLYRHQVKWSKEKIPHINAQEPEAIVLPREEPLHQECFHFLQCCEKRIAPKTDGKEGLQVLKVLQAAQESLSADGEAKHPQHDSSLAIHV